MHASEGGGVQGYIKPLTIYLYGVQYISGARILYLPTKIQPGNIYKMWGTELKKREGNAALTAAWRKGISQATFYCPSGLYPAWWGRGGDISGCITANYDRRAANQETKTGNFEVGKDHQGRCRRGGGGVGVL